MLEKSDYQSPNQTKPNHLCGNKTGVFKNRREAVSIALENTGGYKITSKIQIENRVYCHK